MWALQVVIAKNEHRMRICIKILTMVKLRIVVSWFVTPSRQMFRKNKLFQISGVTVRIKAAGPLKHRLLFTALRRISQTVTFAIISVRT
jgi:hypothetical protein